MCWATLNRTIQLLFMTFAMVVFSLFLVEGSSWTQDAIVAPQYDEFAIAKRRFELLYDSAQFSEALVQAKQNVLIAQQKYGNRDPQTTDTMVEVAICFIELDRLSEAEQLLREIFAIRERAFGSDDGSLAEPLDDLARVYLKEGRITEALTLSHQALSLRERSRGLTHPLLAKSLNNIAQAYIAMGRDAEAEPVIHRAVSIFENATGPNNPELIPLLSTWGTVLTDLKRNEVAAGVYKQAISIIEKTKHYNHPYAGLVYNNLAALYGGENRWGDAEIFLKQMIINTESSLGPDNSLLALGLCNLGAVYTRENRLSDAEPLLERCLSIREKALGNDNVSVAEAHSLLASLYTGMNELALALDHCRKAISIYREYNSINATTLTGIPQLQADVFQNRSYARVSAYVADIMLTGALLQQRFGSKEALTNEAFEAAQSLFFTRTASALSQMAVRVASNDSALAPIVRQIQDIVRKSAQVEANFSGSAMGEAQVSYKTESELLRRKYIETAAILSQRFPNFSQATTANPISINETQSLLSEDEALLCWIPTGKTSYVFVVTKEDFAWRPIVLDNDLSTSVSAFRRGLDITEINKAITNGKRPGLFDLGRAYEFYNALFGPIEPLIKGKKQLLIVPWGALTALPFDLLVTEKPSVPKPDPFGYRDAAWLIKRQAITVLPSVASLKALRVFARKDEARKPMVGFGDPVFSPGAAPAIGAHVAGSGSAARSLTTDSYADFWQGAEIDRTKLAQDLPPLPGTAVELKAVAKDLEAPFSDIHLGRDASVTTVKRLPLADYRVVYFATHALVAGDVKGLGEPALALSIPAHPTALDDGLLTASEVAQLKLDADWVVLSACNTAAGDKPGAEALSGLARAFFYAGARALLVSQWAVSSDAATRLATSTFDILKANPTIGRAEALRRAELAYLNDTSDPRDAYPAFWGPFEIVGEGANR